MTRPITRRVSTVRLPKPCGYCMGDVYIGVEGYDGAVCVDCRKQPTKPLAAAMQDALANPTPDTRGQECPICGEGCDAGEGVEHIGAPQ